LVNDSGNAIVFGQVNLSNPASIKGTLPVGNGGLGNGSLAYSAGNHIYASGGSFQVSGLVESATGDGGNGSLTYTGQGGGSVTLNGDGTGLINTVSAGGNLYVVWSFSSLNIQIGNLQIGGINVLTVSGDASKLTSTRHPGMASGRFYPPSEAAVNGNGSQTIPAVGTLYFVPVFIPAGTVVKTLSVVVGLAGAGSDAVHLGIYTNNSGSPGSLVKDFGTATTLSLGAATTSSSPTTMTGGWYWIACLCNITTAKLDFIPQLNSSTATGYLTGFTAVSGNPNAAIQTTGLTYSSGLPSTASGTLTLNASSPIIYLGT
jgi:hypothetical protein